MGTTRTVLRSVAATLISLSAVAHAGALVGSAVNQDAASWSFHPAGASSSTRSCVAMAAHAAPASYELASIVVSCFDGTAWKPLGGRVSHTYDPSSVHSLAAFAPSMVMLGETPYVAWYEGAGYNLAQIFVAHFDGASWVQDGGAVSTTGKVGVAPTLAVIGGAVHAAWIENNCARVARLAAGAWTSLGDCIRGDATATTARALALSSVGGLAHLAIAEDAVTRIPTSSLGAHVTRVPLGVHVMRWSGSQWDSLAGAVASGVEAHGVDLLEIGGIAYVAWVQQAGRRSVAQLAHLAAGAWVVDSDALNADAQLGWATTPALGALAGVPFVAFSEHSPGQPARIQVRHLQPQGVVVDSVGNVDVASSAASPRLFGDGTSLRLVFTEKPALPGVGTVYVRSLP